MLDKQELLKILNTYNITSNKYGPTIYEKENKLGICLDIKESTFGYLTRIFTFNDKDTLNEFLTKYSWYKKNKTKYNITLNFDKYNTKEPNIKYLYQNQELSLTDMLNLKEVITKNENNITEENKKYIYLTNIKALTEYLINIKKNKEQIKIEKNNLKTKENDLKHELLENLTIYYGRPKKPEKKAVSLENIFTNNDISVLQNNEINIQNKSLNDIKNYLTNLINITKEEELDEKHLVNIYSNNIYKYNIEILTKQIEFVKHKIEAEKNFNLKGSKIHNIDEELKSFLKNVKPPQNLNDYLNTTKTNIVNKYNAITNIEDAYYSLTGNNLNLPKKEIKTNKNEENPLKILTTKFNDLPLETKTNLIIYNSFYKNICNYIIDNNPSIEDIKKNFDFNYYYHTLDEIIHNEYNSHYLITYFKNINFKTLDTYISSLISLSNVLTTTFTIPIDLKLFTLNKNTTYKEYSLNPLFSKEQNLYIDIPSNTNLIYIPDKIIVDEKTNELTLEKTNNIYIKGNITLNNETITVNKYNKIEQKDKESAIIITRDLKLNDSYTFYLGKLEEQK